MKPCTPFHIFNHHYSNHLSVSEYDCLIKIVDLANTDVINRVSKKLLLEKLQILRDDLCSSIKHDDDIKYCSQCGDLILTGYTDGNINICSMSELYSYLDSLYGPDGWRVSTTDEYIAYDKCYIMIADENGIFKASNWKPIYLED